MTYNPLIFGKSPLEKIVSCEVSGSNVELFFEENGTVRSEFKKIKHWILSPVPFDKECKRMAGDLHYKYIKFYESKEDFLVDKKKHYRNDIYFSYDDKEAIMLLYGFTYFKGLKVNDVSVLAFDIESTGLEHSKDAKVLLISNTFRKNGIVVRKLFAYDDYNTEAGMFDAWCEWVREVNPSVIVGHNVFTYDFPYLEFCANKANTSLNLGRDSSSLKINSYVSKFRKDGSQSYEYNRSYIYGREIIDTMFLSYKYDFARKYESYRLKSIIKQEGLEVKDRVFYDADQIRFKYKDKEEWEKIKQYAIHDADDALALYDLMVPSYFYLSQSVPKSFQDIGYSASGSQINSFLVRSYLQGCHSVPKASDVVGFEGAISYGIPGVFSNCFKVDVASLYPSIMLEYQIYDKYKDPEKHFIQMVDYFTKERFVNKRKAKETGDKYYTDLEQAGKIVINSCYGLLGAQGLHFNSPLNAALVTRRGREILQKSIKWATGLDYETWKKEHNL